MALTQSQQYVPSVVFSWSPWNYLSGCVLSVEQLTWLIMNSHDRQNVEKAKDIDIVSYLKSLGLKPKRISGINAYYYSPLRQENNPSLCVNIQKNRWALYNEDNAYGDVIDLVQLLEGCKFGEAVDKLTGDTPSRRYIPQHSPPHEKDTPEAISIDKVSPLTDMGLIEYGLSRAVDINILKRYYKQVSVRFPGSNHDPFKVHLCLGFINDGKGYDLRNSYLKVASPPKTITTIKGKGSERYLFEGHFNFTSLLSYFNLDELPGTVYVLNGVGQSGALAEFLRGKHIYYYGDVDSSGNKVLDALLERDVRVTDCRRLYKGFNDFNDYILNQPM